MPVDKIISPNAAIGAYANTAKIGGGSAADTAGQTSFGEFLRDATDAAIQTMRAGEKASAQAVTGEANLNDVVQAITSAELTLQTVVAIRDRMVNALQEVIRMPI